MKSYSTLADQPRHRDCSTPVPRTKPQRVALCDADARTVPPGPITGRPVITSRSNSPQAPPALTNTSVWPEVTPSRPATVPNEFSLVRQLVGRPAKTKPNE